MVPFTRATCLRAPDMDLAPSCGPMVRVTRANGAKIKLTARVNSGTQMAMFTKATGKMTKQMAMESMFTRTVPSMKAPGRMIFKTAKVPSHGAMAASTKAGTRRV